jgi:hypothetical protein
MTLCEKWHTLWAAFAKCELEGEPVFRNGMYDRGVRDMLFFSGEKTKHAEIWNGE